MIYHVEFPVSLASLSLCAAEEEVAIKINYFYWHRLIIGQKFVEKPFNLIVEMFKCVWQILEKNLEPKK